MATKINTMNPRGGPPGRDNGGPHGYHESVSTKFREACGESLVLSRPFRWPNGMPGGPDNPLGARALYLAALLYTEIFRAAAVLADDTEADAELLELGRQLAALFEEHAIASEEYDRAFAEFVQPERPATLKATTDDLALIGDPETVGGPIGRSRRR